MEKRIGLFLLIICIFSYSFFVWYNSHTFFVQPALKKSTARLISPYPTGGGEMGNIHSWSLFTYNHDFRLYYPPGWVVSVAKDNSVVTFSSPQFHQDDDFSKPYGDSTQVMY